MRFEEDDESELLREVQACDVRLGLLPPFDSTGRNEAFRHELQERRARAVERLAVSTGSAEGTGSAA
jgi:hypothetical protein